jgi:hypothetical protein
VKYFGIFGVAVLTTSAAFAQYVISARSGLIHYTEGKVFLDEKLTASKAAEFPDMKDGQVLRTELGRAEVLFSPGVFLRVAENSAFRMLSNDLEKTAIELTQGSVLLEAGEVEKGQTIRIAAGSATVEVTKAGLYRVDSDPALLRVYEGSAMVLTSGAPATVKEGRQTMLAGVVSPEKFNKEIGDPFHRWAGRRAGYIAMANIAAAKSLSEQNTDLHASSWYYNPYFGSFTYMPFQGRYVGPFGWNYYSPSYMQSRYYAPSYTGTSGGGFGGGGGISASSGRGYGDMGGRSGVSASPSYSPPAQSSSPAPAASAPRSGDSGSSREGRGGR